MALELGEQTVDTSGLEPERPVRGYTRPAVWVTLALAAGVALHPVMPVIPAVYVAGACALAVLAMGLRWARAACVALLGLSLLLAGLGWTQIRAFGEPANGVVHRAADEPTLVRARLRVAEPPVVRQGAELDMKSTACRASVLAVEGGTEWREASGEVLLRIAGEMPELRCGYELEVLGMMSRIDGPANPGEYDWRSHFGREGIFVRISVAREQAVRVLKAEEPLLARVRRKAREALSVGLRGGETSAMVQALLFGDSDDRLEGVWSDFRASGTAHHLSISGMHIAVVAGFVAMGGRLLRWRPRVLAMVTVGVGVGYAMLARPSPPVMRSVLLCVAMGLALQARRNVDPLQCLFVAVLGMIVWNPMDLYNPGFQLSFGTVAGLMLLATPVLHWAGSLEHEHERMARRIRPPTGWAKLWDESTKWLVRGFSAGFVAYAITLPLVMIHFRQVNPWAVPGGMILAPMVSATLLAGLVKTALCAVWPGFGWLAGWPVEGLAGMMRQTVAMLARLPGAQWSSSGVPLGLLLGYVGLMATPWLPGVRGWKLKWVGPVVGMVMLSLWPALGQMFRDTRGLTVTFLDVGNASTTVVELPGGEAVMVDCGGARQEDLFGRTIEPFLRECRIASVAHVLLTHEDMDHRSALPEVARAFSPVVWRRLVAGQPLAFGGQTKWEVLAPPTDEEAKGNDASAVVRLSFAGRTVLFAGDIQEAGIERLLEVGVNGKVDVLVAPHHGSSEKLTETLLGQLAPDWIICSSGPRLSGPQKRFDELVAGRQVVRTGHAGAIRVRVWPDGAMAVERFTAGTWRPAERAVSAPAR